MTNNKLFLLIGTSMSLIPQTINAQCVATQDCTTLGYTETSCSGGSGVKCPFGNKWACFKTDAEVCQKYGFTNVCSGTGQVGKGESCALIYINNAIAKALINMPAPAPDIPVVPAPHATANTPNAPVPADMNGKMAAVRNKFSTGRKVICIIATAR